MHQVPDKVAYGDWSVGRRPPGELEELKMFSAQLRGKHQYMEQCLALQDGLLQRLEVALKGHNPAPHTAAFLHRLHQRLTEIKVSPSVNSLFTWYISLSCLDKNPIIVA